MMLELLPLIPVAVTAWLWFCKPWKRFRTTTPDPITKFTLDRWKERWKNGKKPELLIDCEYKPQMVTTEQALKMTATEYSAHLDALMAHAKVQEGFGTKAKFYADQQAVLRATENQRANLANYQRDSFAAGLLRGVLSSVVLGLGTKPKKGGNNNER